MQSPHTALLHVRALGAVRPLRLLKTGEGPENADTSSFIIRFPNQHHSKMASSGMLRRVALVRTDVSEELSASIIKITRGQIETSAVTSNRRNLCRLLVTASVVPSSPILVTLMKEALRSSETSVLTRATRRNIPEDAILHSRRRENLKYYINTT
jgi:hypothetical protein